MNTRTVLLTALAALTLTAGCSEKKKYNTVIAQRVVKVAPAKPVSMQEYTDTREITWVNGNRYTVKIQRQPADSLPMVKDETGQKFIDNTVRMSVSRADGSVFFSHTFRKSSFASQLDSDYMKTGILEGFVFDKVDGDNLLFAASVSHPQTDEYIPLVVKLSRMGVLTVMRDTEMDTAADNNADEDSDGDDEI